MNLHDLKETLSKLSTVEFFLPNGIQVPVHAHLTEVGKIEKHFIDCGGTERTEETISVQLWVANDYDHRLTAEKFLSIVEMSEKALKLNNVEIEVEYQGDTIEKFGLSTINQAFLLTAKKTNCLAQDKCGIPQAESIETESNCTPGSGCC